MTTLGTPLSPHATKVMLLGSGELGKEVLIALQRLGVETIAVDRYDNAPGQQVAHHARTITMSDPAQLKALVEAERPMLVVPEIEAIATPMLEELEAAGTGSFSGRIAHYLCEQALVAQSQGHGDLALELLGHAQRRELVLHRADRALGRWPSVRRLDNGPQNEREHRGKGPHRKAPGP